MPRALAPHNSWLPLSAAAPTVFTEVQPFEGVIMVIVSQNDPGPNVTEDGYELPPLNIDRRSDLVGSQLRLWVRAKGDRPVRIYHNTI